MAFIFPEAGRIASLGHVNATAVLSTDQLREYVIYVRAARDAFFGPNFRYARDGAQLRAVADEGGAGAAYVQEPALRAAFADGANVCLHHGSRHVLFKHAFAVGAPVELPVAALPPAAADDANHAAAGPGAAATVRLYAVFLDRTTGAPLPPWSVAADDGAVEVLFEHWSDGATFLGAGATGARVAELLGVPGLLLPALPGAGAPTVCGPGAFVTASGAHHAADSLVTLVVQEDEGQGGDSAADQAAAAASRPVLAGASAGAVVGRWLPAGAGAAGAAASGSTPIRAVRALERGVQTLVFATAQLGPAIGSGDAQCCGNSAADRCYPLYRCAPGIAGPADAVPVATCGADDVGGGGASADACRIAFTDPAPDFASAAHPVYLRRLCAEDQQQHQQAGEDPLPPPAPRAWPMHLPAVGVHVTAGFADGTRVDGRRALAPGHAHSAMPAGGLGTRLLQMLSVLCRPDYCPARCTAPCLDDDTCACYDLRRRLARQLDLSGEPGSTHEAIAQSLNAFFRDPARRTAFLNEFDAKFPGILTDPRLFVGGEAGAASVGAAVALHPDAELSLVVFLTIDFCVPDADAGGGARASRLNAVPIVFSLV
jgi:hypothetical protein